MLLVASCRRVWLKAGNSLMQFAIRRPAGYGEREQSEKDPGRWYRRYVGGQGCTTCAIPGQLGMRLRGRTSFAGCSIRAMPCTSMIVDGTEIWEDAKVKGKQVLANPARALVTEIRTA